MTTRAGDQGGGSIDDAMEFGILGPTAVWVGGRPQHLRAVKPKVLLAALLLRPNEAQSADYLASALWTKAPPTDPRATLHTYVARLRRFLAESGTRARVRASSGGYLIEVDRVRVDLGGFGMAVEAADDAARGQDIDGEVDALRTASALWRGDPLSDVPSDLLHREVVPHLTEWRLQVVRRRIDLELRLDRHAELIAELRAMTAQHPLHEGFWAQLMTALFRSGRQAEALDAYESVRTYLRDELGSDPGEELSLLHRAVLLGDLPAAQPDRVAASTSASSWLSQDRLPSDADRLVGRARDISALVDLLQPGAGGGMPIVAVTGAPGIGKSALAVRAGHRLRASYPDGRWYVDLGGVGRGRRATGEILDELLRTAGVPARDIPAGEGERAGLLRARLAGRRVLLILDDAASASQVSPVLPGSPGCGVLITSRNGLSGLTAWFGSTGYPLAGLADPDASILLRHLLGPDRLAAEPDAVADLVTLCAGMPLALRIAAANLSFFPAMRLAAYVAELRRDRLAALAVPGERAIAVRRTFDLSYESLGENERRTFRLLGLLPGAEFSGGLAVAVTGRPAARVSESVADLVSAHLVEQRGPDRFRTHDLLRVYAADRADTDETPDGRGAARRRAFDWYLAGAHEATTRLDPGYSRQNPGGTATRPAAFGSARDAADWLDLERQNVVAAIEQAAEIGPTPYAWRLFDAVLTDLMHRQHTDQWATAVRAALRAAEAAADSRAITELRLSQGTLLWALGRFGDAAEELRVALGLAREHLLHDVMVKALNNLGLVHLELGELDLAANYLAEAAPLLESAGASELARGSLMNNLGVVHLERGDLRLAAAASQEGARIHRGVGSIRAEEIAESNLGAVYRALGESDTADEHYQRALELARTIAAPPEEAAALVGIAGVHRDRGAYQLARRSAEDGLAIAEAASHRRSRTDALIELGAIDLAEGNPRSALDRYAEAHRTASELGYRRAEIEALTGLALAGQLAGADGDHVTIAESATELARAAGLRLLEAHASAAAARIHAARGDVDAAAREAHVALDLYLACHSPSGQAQARGQLADALAAGARNPDLPDQGGQAALRRQIAGTSPGDSTAAKLPAT